MASSRVGVIGDRGGDRRSGKRSAIRGVIGDQGAERCSSASERARSRERRAGPVQPQLQRAMQNEPRSMVNGSCVGGAVAALGAAGGASSVCWSYTRPRYWGRPPGGEADGHGVTGDTGGRYAKRAGCSGKQLRRWGLAGDGGAAAQVRRRGARCLRPRRGGRDGGDRRMLGRRWKRRCRRRPGRRGRAGRGRFRRCRPPGGRGARRGRREGRKPARGAGRCRKRRGAYVDGDRGRRDAGDDHRPGHVRLPQTAGPAHARAAEGRRGRGGTPSHHRALHPRRAVHEEPWRRSARQQVGQGRYDGSGGRQPGHRRGHRPDGRRRTVARGAR